MFYNFENTPTVELQKKQRGNKHRVWSDHVIVAELQKVSDPKIWIRGKKWNWGNWAQLRGKHVAMEKWGKEEKCGKFFKNEEKIEKE